MKTEQTEVFCPLKKFDPKWRMIKLKDFFFVWLYKQLDIKVQKMEYYLPLNDYQVFFLFFMIYGHLSEFHVPFPSSWKLHLQ